MAPPQDTVSSHIPSSDSLMAAINSTPAETLRRYRYQCSLDVVALYTSVPVEEALTAIQTKLLLNVNIVPSPLQIEDVIQLLRTTFGLTYFHHEDKVYRQITGLPMGSAISGIVAILFMDTIERRALSLFARCPLFRRYVDDCYVLVENAGDAQELHRLFNSQHPTIKFELEECQHEGETTSLSLLDVTVAIDPSGETSFNFSSEG